MFSLLLKDVRTGGCAYLKQEATTTTTTSRYIFYLVTKKFYNHKPYYNCLEQSLTAMLALCQQFNVTKLAMPMIGSGLDRLDWSLVARILDDVFAKSNIKITVYKYEPPERTFRDSNASAKSGQKPARANANANAAN